MKFGNYENYADSYPTSFQGYTNSYASDYYSSYNSELSIKYMPIIMGAVLIYLCFCCYDTFNKSLEKCAGEKTITSNIAHTLLPYVVTYVSYCTIIGVVLLILNIVPTPLMIAVKEYFGIVYAAINIIIGVYGEVEVYNINKALFETKKTDCNKNNIKKGLSSVYNLGFGSLVMMIAGYFGY